MRVLVLGGTGFVGRAVVDALLHLGSDVSVFNRGRAATPPAVTRLTGDRETGDYAELRAGPGWDAVVDVTAYYPWQVTAAMDAVGDRAGRYLFVSSRAVFADASPRRKPPIHDAGPPLTNATYGPSKVACEDEVLARYAERATIVRPGKVAGPHDNQEGLTYWVRAAARGGRVELPGSPDQPVQLVDSRDLGTFVARLLADDRPGAFTAVGDPVSFGELIAICASVVGTEVEIVPVTHGSAPLIRSEDLWPTLRRDPAPARAAGLPATPLPTTVADVAAEVQS